MQVTRGRGSVQDARRVNTKRVERIPKLQQERSCLCPHGSAKRDVLDLIHRRVVRGHFTISSPSVRPLLALLGIVPQFGKEHIRAAEALCCQDVADHLAVGLSGFNDELIRRAFHELPDLHVSTTSKTKLFKWLQLWKISRIAQEGDGKGTTIRFMCCT